jgi:hypothetical protein
MQDLKRKRINRKPKLVNKWMEKYTFLFTNLTKNSYARKRKGNKKWTSVIPLNIINIHIEIDAAESFCIES